MLQKIQIPCNDNDKRVKKCKILGSKILNFYIKNGQQKQKLSRGTYQKIFYKKMNICYKKIASFIKYLTYIGADLSQ